MMKKTLSVILALCLLLIPMSALAAATGTDAEVPAGAELPEGGTTVPETLTLDSVADVAAFILEPLKWCEIQISPAVLSSEEGDQDVYLVALRGTGFSMQKANNVLACFLSAFNLKSKYYELTLESVLKYVPEGSKVVFAGHSLGGMIEQQLSCAEEFTSKYELLHTLNVGSPAVLTNNQNREGGLVRCVDTTDVIPKLSPCLLVNPRHYNDCIRLNGGFLGDPDGAHNLSYMKEDVWGCYDALGVKDGGAALTLRTADINRIQA